MLLIAFQKILYILISSNSHGHDALVLEVVVEEEEQRLGLQEVHDVDDTRHVLDDEQDSLHIRSALHHAIVHQSVHNGPLY